MMGTRDEHHVNQLHIKQLRKQLRFTEKNLETLNCLAEEEDIEVNLALEESTFKEPVKPLTLQDLSPSILPLTPIKPRGCNEVVISSTPKMATRNCTSAQSSFQASDIHTSHSDSEKSSQRSHTVTEMMNSVNAELPGNLLEEENEELRQKLHNQRKRNAELTANNHELLNQVETLTHRQHHYKLKLTQLVEQLDESNSKNEQLQVVITDKEQLAEQLVSELDKHQAYTADVESRMTKLSKEFDDQLQKNGELAEYVNKLRSELSICKKLKERAEQECEQALEAAEAMQKSVEEFQRKQQSHVYQQEAREKQLTVELSESHQRQEMLEQQLRETAGEMADLREEIRRFQEENASERDARTLTEQENVELCTQLSKLTEKLGKLTSTPSSNSELQKKTRSLEQLVSELRCALDEANQKAAQTEAKLSHVLSCQTQDPSDSGLGMSDNSTSLIQDLRVKLQEKERQITSLMSRLQHDEQDVENDSDTSLIQIKTEKDQLQRHVEELELFISSLEEERRKHTSRLLKLEEERTELQLQVSSLTAKLEHKTKQTDCLQGELSEVNSCTVTLERQLRKSENECGALKRQLDDRSRQSEQLRKQNNQLQEQLDGKIDEVQRMKNEIHSLRNQIKEAESRISEQQTEHRAKTEQLQLNIAELRESLSEREDDLQKTLSDMDKVSQDLNAKQMALMDMQHELKAAKAESQRVVQSVEKQSNDGLKKIEELQTSLSICQHQLQMYMNQMDDCKAEHDEEIRVKSQKIFELEQELSTKVALLAERDQRVAELEKQLHKGNSVLKMSSEKLTELESKQGILESQVTSLQTQLEQEREEFESEKAKLGEQIQISEDKLTKAHQDLTSCEQELRGRDKQIETLQHDLVAAEQQVDDLRSQLEEAHSDISQLEAQVSQLEEQLDDARLDLRNHKNQLDSIESEITSLQDEIDRKNDVISELRSKLQGKCAEVSQLKIELETTRGQHQVGDSQLKRLEEAIAEKDSKLTELGNRYSAVQESLEHKQAEIEQLYTTLRQQEYQLHQRSSQITQLDLVLKEHKNDTEQRLAALNAAYKKSQLEAEQRLKQVTALDEQVSLLKDELQQKELLLEESTKSCSRQQYQLHSSSDNISTLQQQVNDLKNQLMKVKEENTELQKELDAANEEEKRLQQQLTEAKCESSLSQRQNERLNQQIEEYMQQCKGQEVNAASLAEALEMLKVQKAQLVSRHEAAKRQLQRELDELRTNYQQQLDQLRRDTSQAADSLQKEQDLLRHQLEEAKDSERHLLLELESTRAELEQKSRELFTLSAVEHTAKETKSLITKASPEKDVTNKTSDFHQLSANLVKLERNRDSSRLKHPLTSSKKSKSQPDADSQSVKSQLERLNQKCQPFLQDFHKTFPSGGSHGSLPSATDSDSHGLASQLTALSISDISHADTTMTRYVISEPDDPDSLQSMLKEVQKMCSQSRSDPSSANSTLGKSTSQTRTQRCFGARAWPQEHSGAAVVSKPGLKNPGLSKSISADSLRCGTMSGNRKNTMAKKGSKSEELAQNRGPLHSSPQTKGTRSSFGLRKDSQAEKSASGCGGQRNASKTSAREKNTRRSNVKSQSPALIDKSPNVSTAIAHYSEEREATSEQVLDESSSSGSSSGSSIRSADADQQGDTTIQSLGSLDIAERRKVLAAMQLELKSQLTAVDQHLDAATHT